MRRRVAGLAAVVPVFARELDHRANVLYLGVVLDDGAGVHNVSAVGRHLVDDPPAVLADPLRIAKAEDCVGHAAGDAELLAELFVDLEDIVLIDVVDDAAVR